MKKTILMLFVFLSASNSAYAQEDGSKVCLRVIQKADGNLATQAKFVGSDQKCPRRFKAILNTATLRGSSGPQGPAGEQGPQGPTGEGGATFAGGSGSIRTNETNYLPASGVVLVGGISDEGQTQVLIPRTCTAGNFQVSLSAASGGTKTFTFRINGADSGITCTITNPATTCSSGNVAAITAGDRVAVKHVDVGSTSDVNGYLGWTCS